MSKLPTILIIDDEQRIVDLYALRLDGQYDVRTATNGTEALESMDASVDVVLLDRRMPDMTGAEVLKRIRETGYDCKVAMVTAVDPDFDILEMGFDAYVVKPVSTETLTDIVETLLEREGNDDHRRERAALLAKKAALEAEKSEGQLKYNSKYQQLTDRLEDLRQSPDDDVARSDDEDLTPAFYPFAQH